MPTATHILRFGSQSSAPSVFLKPALPYLNWQHNLQLFLEVTLTYLLAHEVLSLEKLVYHRIDGVFLRQELSVGILRLLSSSPPRSAYGASYFLLESGQ